MVWLVLFGVGAVAWKFLYQPKVEEAREQEHKEWLDTGSSESRYDHRLNLSLDAFSGYAILRSPEFRKELAGKSIKVNLLDDGADYTKRLADLKSGSSQMAVFTIDALLKACAEEGDLPASIVAIIDETRGADAIVGYKNKYPDVDSFNDPNLKFVLTPNSPSETLARVVISQFDLPSLGQNPFIEVDGADKVYDRCRKASQNDSQVYVLWEPFVSKAVENPNLEVITSSGDLFGYIVDVLVVSRDFLANNEDVAKDVVECYFRAAFKYRSQLNQLVLDDAKAAGEPLSPKQAERLVNGVQWKNTQRNYAHFGIVENQSSLHIEDMIENISRVLISTSGMAKDPTNGSPNLLYYKSILEQLASENFHPAGAGGENFDDSIKLRQLTAKEWRELSSVGTLKVEKLIFRRGRAALAERSRGTLDDLADTLRTQRYYLKVSGVATRQGDLDLNKQLAADRAAAAVDYLVAKGIDSNRIEAAEPSLGDQPSVTFTLGQLPY
jgi:outer membrane protein OmpA-like peptidoglycan-associated protein